MRASAITGAGIALALTLPALPAAATAQASPSQTHIGHVAEGFRGTPEGQGLMATAVAEAEVAAQHAGLAARDLENLGGMQRHAGHVLHAVDPSQVEGGPGKGYGLIRAAEGVAQHIRLAGRAEGATDGVSTHATHVATSATNTAERARRIAELAAQIAEAESASDAAPLMTELNELAQALIPGHDANGDGRTGWQEGEGGLQQAQTHLGLLMR